MLATHVVNSCRVSFRYWQPSFILGRFVSSQGILSGFVTCLPLRQLACITSKDLFRKRISDPIGNLDAKGLAR